MVPTLAATPGAGGSRCAAPLALLAIVLVFSAGRVFALDPTSHISQYGHSVWRVQDGYFGGAPQAITQTTDGYIWVGTEAGLFKFDGVTFVRWSAKSGEPLPSNAIWGLLGARDGSLWIATEAGLAHLVNNRLSLYLKNTGWLVAQIFEDRDGRIWFRRNRAGDRTHSFCQVVGTDVHCYGSEDGVDELALGPIAQDASGDFWLGSGLGFVRWRPGSSTVYRPKVLASNEMSKGVTGLVPAVDGSLWVGMEGTGSGAGLQHLMGGTLKPYLAPDLNGESLAVTALLSDRQNTLWVGTATQGLYKIRGVQNDHIGSTDGLSSDWVTTIFEDREGNIWAATSKGIDMFRDFRVKTISHREGLIKGAVESLAASRDGNLWVGVGGHLEVLGPSGASLFGPGKNLPANVVTSLFPDDAGRLWAGIINRLFVDEAGSFREVTKQDGGALGMAMGIAEDSGHNIWVESAGPPGTLFLIQDLKVRHQFAAPAMPLARKIVADDESGIWLGLTTGDLARYQNGKLTTFTFGDHPNTRVRAITAYGGSILGATGFGVVGWKKGEQQTLTVQNGLPCNTVNTVISDDAGNLWLSAECGLVEIPKQQMQLWWGHPESHLTMKVFDVIDGFQPGWAPFNSSAKTPDGRLWFANDSVVQVIDPAHIPENTLPPPVHIRALIADRKEYLLDSEISLPPRTRGLEIDYTALSFSAPQKVLFRYMLEGHDSDWQEPGTRRQAFYNDLAPGKYRFRVRACNNDGIWNETGASLDFSILPAYYQTSWFRALCVAGFLLLLWVVYRMRVRQVARAMSVRFDERLQERTRIAQDFHDTYLQTIQGSKLVADSALKQSPDPARMRGALEQLSVWLGRATEEGRAALKSLRSSATEKNDLAAAFERAIEECRIDSPMEAFFSVSGAVSEMHPIVRDEVYRIGYEAIRNACVHSRGTRLQVELTYADNLTLRVRDNGSGIAPAMLDGGKHEHFGLRGMRERAERIMATFKIDTSQGSGTEITLVVPGDIIYRRSGGVKRPAIETLLKKLGLKSADP